MFAELWTRAFACALLPLLLYAGGVCAKPALEFDFPQGTASLTGLVEAPPAGRETDFLVVRVFSSSSEGKLPAMAGAYDYADGTLTFRSMFGFDLNVVYKAEAPTHNLRKGLTANGPPTPDRSRPTTVDAVYPEASELPENHLRFYLHFSAPMSRGFAAKHVRLLDSDGKPLAIPFLDLAEELWDREGTRLTLLLDPARVKSGLVPHEEEGPVLVRGNSYMLEIDNGFEDAFGKPLREPFRRGFSVGEPDTTQPTIEDWNITAPEVGTLAPVVVTFGQVLDHALLLRMIEVVTADGKPVAGALAARDGDTACTFIPDAPWEIGHYELRVNRLLEDPSGNSIARPFELKDETFAPRSVRTHAALGFEVRAAETR